MDFEKIYPLPQKKTGKHCFQNKRKFLQIAFDEQICNTLSKFTASSLYDNKPAVK